MGNEVIKEEAGEESADETAGADQKTNKLSILDETSIFFNNTIRKLSNANAETVVQDKAENSANNSNLNSNSNDVKMAQTRNGITDTKSDVASDETANSVSSFTQDKFNSKLRQTVLALNALKGTGDECHAFVVTNASGQRLAGYHWKPRAFKIGGKKVRMPGGPRAVVFILHGAGEHCQWYDVIARPLNAQGITVCAHDHIGHGMSEGDRVHADSFSEYTRDVVQHLEIIHHKYPESPIYLLGHSMGGTIGIKTLLDHKSVPVKGLILIAPGIVPNADSVSPFKIFMAKLASKLTPQLEVGPIKPEFICNDPEIVKKYVEDPLVWHGGLKARMACELLEAFEDIQKRLHEFTAPYLLIHGSGDKITDVRGSDIFNEGSASQDKTYKRYDGAAHQVHNEPGGVGAQCIQEITDWVVHRL